MSKPAELTEEEFYELVHKIAKPTFKFMLKRINNEVLKGENYKSLDMNHFFNAIVAAMAMPPLRHTPCCNNSLASC